MILRRLDDIIMLNGAAAIGITCLFIYFCPLFTFLKSTQDLTMRNLFLILALIPLFTIAQNPPSSATPANGFTITGNIAGLPKGAEVKLLNANTNVELATATVVEKKTTVKRNGKLVPVTQTSFVLKGAITEPDLSTLSITGLKPFNLYVENSPITITGTNTDMAKWVIKGSNSHNDFVHFEKSIYSACSKFKWACRSD